MYEYKAKILRVVDGDTVDAEVDFGFNVRAKMRLRLYGIDTPELNDTDHKKREMAKKAKDRVEEIFSEKAEEQVTIKTFKNNKERFGDYLVRIYFKDQMCLNDLMLEEKLAKPYEH